MDFFVQKYKDWKFHSQFQEILPDDMDDEYMFSEKQSIRDSGRSLKKYGSLSNHTRTNETLLRHEIEKTDTLQGIALKYGCTTEQIRRTNRLFASDSLFLRQFLLVPVDKASPYYAKALEDSAAAAAASVETGKPVTPQTPSEPSTASAASSHGSGRPSNGLPPRPYSIAGDVLHLQNGVCGTADDEVNHNHNAVTNGGANSKQSKSLDSVMALSPEEENRKCINDFLSKIDSTISESRKYVEKSKEMITSQSDDGLFVSVDVVQRRRNNHLNNSYKQEHYQAGNQQQQQHMRQSSTGSSSDMSYLLNTTQTRRVQNSLKRLEKQQDDFFEL